MMVLSIIGIFILIVLIYGLVDFLNKKTYSKFKYKFFTEEAFYYYVVIDMGLFFGYQWYSSALIKKADTLNGILIIFFACCIFLYLLNKNIKRTNYSYGILLTIFQFIIYLPLSIFGAAGIIFAISYFLQTKPVINLNR